MTTEYFRYLYDYHYWANARILNAAEEINHAEFVAPTKFSHGSLRGTLVHALSAEWILVIALARSFAHGDMA
jgi:uncharacterized damage-inducible protein DinB